MVIADTTSRSARRDEWRAVSEFLERSSVEPCALVVEGEAGIGKTTFWLAACEHARASGFCVLSARGAAAEAVLAYAALADLLAGIEPDAWANLPDPQRLALDRLTLRSTDDGSVADQRTVAAAFLAVIEELAQHQRVILAVDDLQWLDPSSALAIAFATRRISGPVGVLATVRTGQAENPAAWLELPRPDAVRRISLPPMRLGALHHVVSQRLGQSISRPGMVRIHEVSGGNPFYAIELARVFEDDAAGTDIRLSATLSDLVRARLTCLRSDVQDVLIAAACLGQPTVELLASALPEISDGIDQLLQEAEAAGVLVLDGHQVRFSHPLLGSGAYTDATAARRRAMHRRLAGVVEEPELRARHLALAATRGDPATVESLDAAAEIARMRGAPAAAAELLDLAIGLGGDTARRRIGSAALHFTAGDSAHARTILERVLDRPASAGLRAEALSLLAVISQLEGSVLEGFDALERALVDAGDDLALRVQILVSLAWAHTHIAGEFAKTSCFIEDAVAGATRLNDPHLLSQALGMSAVVHILLGDGLEEQKLRRAVELESGQAAITVMFRPAVHDAILSAWTGQFDAARAKFLALRRGCIERGEESELVFVTFHQVLNEIWRANFAEAALIAEDTVERARQLGGTLPLAAALTVRALVAAYAGHETDARRDIDDAMGPMRQSGSALLLAWPVAALGFLEVSLGDYRAAITALEPLLDRVTAAPHATEIFVAWFLPDAVESLINVGRLDEAEPLIAAFERNGRRLDRAWMLAVGARCRGMLSAARGDVAGGAQAVQHALGHHEQLTMPFERARTMLLLGQLQRRQRRKETSARTIREALAVFEELDTPLWADRARAELDRSSVGQRRGAGLTPSEKRVAELAASGMTNRDVAATLFISPKTVETNLAHIYRKLGIRSRVELAQHLWPVSR